MGWLFSTDLSPLVTLFAGSTGFFGSLVLLLFLQDEPVALPEEQEAPLLLGEKKAPERRSLAAPLSPQLRDRFRQIHQSVAAMVSNRPKNEVMPIEPEKLEKIPEAFRHGARILDRLKPSDPGVERIEKQLESLEDLTERLRASWSLLVSDAPEGGEAALEDLADTVDRLETWIEVEGEARFKQ